MAEPREAATVEVSLARIAWSLKELSECAKKIVAMAEQKYGAAPELPKKQWNGRRDNDGF
jgi:hypothetical protein